LSRNPFAVFCDTLLDRSAGHREHLAHQGVKGLKLFRRATHLPSIVILFIAISSCALAQEHPEIPNKKSDTNAGQKQSNQPIQITIEAPDPDPKAAQEKRDYDNANLAIQRQMADATNLIAKVTIVQAVLGLLAFYAAMRSAKAAVVSAEMAQTNALTANRNLALTQRGFLHVGGWFHPSVIEHQTNVPYRLSNRGGHTVIHVLRGEIRLSSEATEGDPTRIDTFDYSRTDKIPMPWRFATEVPPATIGPHEKGAAVFGEIASFPALPPDAMERWESGRLRLFLSGDIWYRDAFEGTDTHHKRFGVTYNTVSKKWEENPWVPNDEVDEADERQNQREKDRWYQQKSAALS
jgi:hypothetical protein